MTEESVLERHEYYWGKNDGAVALIHAVKMPGMDTCYCDDSDDTPVREDVVYAVGHIPMIFLHRPHESETFDRVEPSDAMWKAIWAASIRSDPVDDDYREQAWRDALREMERFEQRFIHHLSGLMQERECSRADPAIATLTKYAQEHLAQNTEVIDNALKEGMEEDG